MTLVSTIGFSYTHHLVALSRNHFRHFRFQTPKWRPRNKIGNRRGGVGSRIEYHIGHMAVTGEHISLSFGNNTVSLLWPSGGHFVRLMTAFLVYRPSKIMFASHRGVYIKILHGCNHNHESDSLLLTILLI